MSSPSKTITIQPINYDMSDQQNAVKELIQSIEPGYQKL